MDDKNYISINGDPAGNVYVNGVLRIRSDQPSEERALAFDEIAPPDASYADALKFSDGVRDLQVQVRRLVGGTEDCFDINNRCRGISLHVGRLEPRGKYVGTIKGESRDITVTGEIHGHGRETDVDLGGHSDQAKGRTTGVRLGLTTPDNSPVRVRVLHAWAPEIFNRNLQHYQIDERAKGFFAVIWSLLKKWGLIS